MLILHLKWEENPFVLDKTYLKGIEYDLIEAILNKSNIRINSSINLSLNDLHKNLIKKKQFRYFSYSKRKES